MWCNVQWILSYFCYHVFLLLLQCHCCFCWIDIHFQHCHLYSRCQYVAITFQIYITFAMQLQLGWKMASKNLGFSFFKPKRAIILVFTFFIFFGQILYLNFLSWSWSVSFCYILQKNAQTLCTGCSWVEILCPVLLVHWNLKKLFLKNLDFSSPDCTLCI